MCQRLSRIRGVTSAVEAIAQLGANADLARTKEAIVEAGRLSMGTELIALFTIDPCLASVECDSTQDVSDQMKHAFLSLYGQRMTDLTCNDPWITDVLSAETTDRQAQRSLLDAGVMSIAACPIRSASSTCGAIAAFYCGPLEEREETTLLLEVLTSHAATALSYAVSLDQSQNLLEGLYGENQTLSHQATVDGLTGLPNHRTFRQTLNELCRQSLGKLGRPLSLVMIDVDHFKAYNDTHGHPEGDSVLKGVATIMSAGLRQNDFAARYGGEEFAILFSGATKESALVAAERIRKTIAEHAFDKGSVTVSMGVAEFPLDTSDPGELIELADKALYHAKSVGRNRVFGWGSNSAPLSSQPGTPSDSHQLTVLVLEGCDDSCTRDLRTSMQNACALTSAHSVAEAQEALKSRAFDVVIVTTDALPDQDTRHLSELAAMRSNMPIVLVADSLPPDETREALRRGASDILTRPYNPAALPLLVERNLESKRLEVQRLMQKGTGVMLQAIEALVAAIDAKDHHTAGHSHRVAELTMSLSDMLGLPDEERYALELASKLHDIGKLALPDSALNKRSALTDVEWQAMREHPVVGAKIVGAISELAYVSTIIRHHHERLDGSGYPDGLSGEAIPYLARIIGVADTYEAMTTERAHKKRLSPIQAIAEIRNGAGTLYESDIVDILERYLRAQGDIPENSEDARAA